MMRWLARVLSLATAGEEGASVVEYAALLLLVATVVLVGMSLFGNALSAFFVSAASSI